MTRNTSTFRWLLLAVLLGMHPASAAPGRDTYQVEILVFEYTAADTGAELWTRGYPPPDLAEAIDFFGAPDTGPARVAPVPPVDGGPVMPRHVPGASGRLVAAAQRLGRATTYRVLYHEAWVQDILPKSSSRAVRIHRTPPLDAFAARETNRLDGLARLYRGRYLQLELELALRQPQDATALAGTMPGGDPLRLSERRRVKPNEVHYFDHPRFGVLFAMTPIEKVAR